MRRFRTAAGLVIVACQACGGDYWLGGTGVPPEGDGAVTPVAPGPNDHVLDADIVLTGDQSLDLATDGAGACRVFGNGHGIRSEGTWTGHLAIRGCTVTGLGSAGARAISLEMSGTASTTLEGNTFDQSGAVHVTNYDDTTTSFRNNVILGTSTVALDPNFDASTPAFYADGDSTAPKVFQGNHVRRSNAWFRSANWLIGGDTDADSNVFVGVRAGVVLSASGLVVRGNYIHNLHLAGSGDGAAVTSIYVDSDALAEHNVLRGGDWVVRGFGGEFRYNVTLDTDSTAWLYQPFENTKVHHNLFTMCIPPKEDVQAGIAAVNARAAGIEIFNNTLDGGGLSMRTSGPALGIDDGSFVSSFHSNLIFDFSFWRNDDGAAAIRPGVLEGVDPPPSRLGYADYNLFFNPDARAAHNYAVAVPGHTLRRDDGFGAHDSHAGGPVDEQVSPGALGLSGCFPWSDEDIDGSRVTVSKMLAAYRAAYAPAPGSAVLGTGDPVEGPTNFIGAVGDGTASGDRFGIFGR